MDFIQSLDFPSSIFDFIFFKNSLTITKCFRLFFKQHKDSILYFSSRLFDFDKKQTSVYLDNSIPKRCSKFFSTIKLFRSEDKCFKLLVQNLAKVQFRLLFKISSRSCSIVALLRSSIFLNLSGKVDTRLDLPFSCVLILPQVTFVFLKCQICLLSQKIRL